MGIIRLGQFFKSTYPHLLKTNRVDTYRKRTFAVDAASTIYSFLAKTISNLEGSQHIRKGRSTCRQIPWETWPGIWLDCCIALCFVRSWEWRLFGCLMGDLQRRKNGSLKGEDMSKSRLQKGLNSLWKKETSKQWPNSHKGRYSWNIRSDRMPKCSLNSWVQICIM